MGSAAEGLAFIGGAAASLATSWLLVTRIERIGERFGLSSARLGLLAALAADTPEITSAGAALSHHQHSVGAGVVLGSNVFNLAALLGLGALVAGRIALHRRVVVLVGAVAVSISAVCVALVVGAIGPGVAATLVLIVMVADVAILGRGVKSGPGPARAAPVLDWLRASVREEEEELGDLVRVPPAGALDVVMAAAALVVVIGASVVMEHAAATLGSRWSVPGIVVGGVVLAAVTSLPNAVAAVYLAAKDRGAAAMSTAMNSNSINVLAGLMLPALVVGVGRVSTTTTMAAAWYAAATVVTLLLAYIGRGLGRAGGAIIAAIYFAFVAAVVLVS